MRWLAWPGGWGEQQLEIPRPVARQLGRAGRFIVARRWLSSCPVYLFDHELIAPEGRPITAPALSRLLVIGFELVVWGVCAGCCAAGRRCWDWLATAVPAPSTARSRLEREGSQPDDTAIRPVAAPARTSGPSRALAGLLWLGERRRLVSCLVLAAIALVIVLDVRGYSFTARRLAAGGSQTTVVIVLAVAAYRSIARAISANGWRWARPRRSWAMALTSAVARRAAARVARDDWPMPAPTRKPARPSSTIPPI